MRDRRFVAVHRGGPLDRDKHRLLAAWAADCAEHVLPLFEKCSSDDRPHRAIAVAKAWARSEVPVGDAQKAAVGAHAAARARRTNPQQRQRVRQATRWPQRTWLTIALGQLFTLSKPSKQQPHRRTLSEPGK